MTAEEVQNEQSVQALYLNQNAKSHRGYGVDNGCTVSVNSGDLDAPDTLQVAAGQAWADWVPVDVSQQDIRIDAADPSDPRRDVVYLDDSGSAGVEKGTPGPVPDDQPTADTFQFYQPPPPDMDGQDVVILAELFVGAAATEVLPGHLEQRRPNTPPQRIIETTDFTASGGGDPAAEPTIDNVGRSQTQALSVIVAPADPATFNANYGWNTQVSKTWDWDQGAFDITLTLTWDADPGPGNDVQMTAYTIAHT